MSSHHVVREKQEPALLLLDLDHFSDEMLGQLLEWSPTVITTNDTAEKLNTYGIKIDYLIGHETAEVLQADVKQLDPGSDGIARYALKFLVDNGFPSVNIIADDLDLDELKPFTGLINLVVFHHGKKIYPVNSGFSKWQPAGVCIRILSPAAGFQFTGLRPAGRRRYMTVSDGLFTLSFSNRFIFIAEDL
jgi:thiamine pyrophosphokinase